MRSSRRDDIFPDNTTIRKPGPYSMSWASKGAGLLGSRGKVGALQPLNLKQQRPAALDMVNDYSSTAFSVPPSSIREIKQNNLNDTADFNRDTLGDSLMIPSNENVGVIKTPSQQQVLDVQIGIRTPQQKKSARKLQGDINYLLDQMKSPSIDVRNVSTTPRVPRIGMGTSIFNQTAVPNQSMRLAQDESTTDSFLPSVGNRAHYVFNSPYDRKRRVLTIAKRVTTKPENDPQGPPIDTTMTRKAALQILLGETGGKTTKHVKIDPTSRKQKHERTKDEIAQLKKDRNSALRNIDNQIDQSFAKESCLDAADQQTNNQYSTIGGSTIGGEELSDRQSIHGEPRSPSSPSKRKRNLLSADRTQQKSTDLHFRPKVHQIGGGSNTSNYCMDIDDKPTRHLFSGGVTAEELDSICKNTELHEPQIKKVRKQIQKQLKTGELQSEIANLLVKARGKGMHDFTVDNFEDVYFPKTKKSNRDKFAVDEKNIYMCEHAEDEARNDRKQVKKSDDLIKPPTNRKDIMLASKRIMVDNFSKNLVAGIIKQSYQTQTQDEENLDWDSSDNESPNMMISSNTTLGDMPGNPTKKQVKAQVQHEIASKRWPTNFSENPNKKLHDEIYSAFRGGTAEEDPLKNSELNKNLVLNPVSSTAGYPSFAEQETIFQSQERKHEFFTTAKGFINNKEPAEDEHIQKAYERYFLECNKNKIIPIPLFYKIKNGVLSLAGNYISEGMALALQTVLSDFMFEDKLIPPPVQIHEVNLDDNGLTDKSFAMILSALDKHHPNIGKFNYSNNEIGMESINIMNKIMSRPGDKKLHELRLSSLRADAEIQYEVLRMVREATSIKKLRLSNFKCTNKRMIKKLKRICENEQLVELNLSNNNLLAKDLAKLMKFIESNDGLKSLNLSHNALISTEAEKAEIDDKEAFAAQVEGRNARFKSNSNEFIGLLIGFIKKSDVLNHLDVSNMNLGARLQQLVWPVYHSRSLQAVHMSNNIDKYDEDIIQNLLFVFGIKADDKVLQQTKGGGGEESEFWKKTDAVVQNQGYSHKNYDNPQKAAAVIANHDQICQVQDQKLQLMSSIADGIGRGIPATNPLVITRKLGHPELIFNEKHDKQLQFDKDAGPRWQLSMKENCWVCQKWKYATIHYDSRYAQQQYTQITDEATITKIKELYGVDENGSVCLTENQGHPYIMASVTNFRATRMSTLANFNCFAAPNEIDKKSCKGKKTSEIQRLLLDLAQGIRRDKAKKIHDDNNKDALQLFRQGILPYPQKDMLMYCLPPEDEFTPPVTPSKKLRDKVTDGLKNRVSACSMLSSAHSGDHLPTGKSQASGMADWMLDEYKEEQFVYSCYLKPGKHTILIYDQVNDWLLYKEILADARGVEISNSTTPANRVYSKINQYKDLNNQMLIDLDNSVFMNFEHFSKSTVEECFENDKLFNNIAAVLDQENGEDKRVMDVIGSNYEIYCEFFQTVSASLNSFPSVKIRELTEFFMKMKLIHKHEDFLNHWQDIEKELKSIRGFKNQEQNLNRTGFLESLIVTLKYCRCHDELKGLELSSALQWVIDNLMVPYLNAPAELVQNTLSQFRRNFIWTPTINHMLFVNLEGIMQIYAKHVTTYNGFTVISAKKVLDDIKLDEIKQVSKNLPGYDEKENQDVLGCNKVLRQQFDLAQMIVLNEIEARREYLDMELMEFLEFLVRISYAATLKHSDLSTKESPYRLKWLLQEMLSCTDRGYVEDKQIDVLLKKEKERLAKLEENKE